ncbi:Mycobacterium terramassiliense ORFan [Mycobacterium terramassiliense]|uniref:Mycobacterium terramassiliense ORFan n=1 Tax=Mycobacterium terramassiliense TaxID=1841859 RepID=A0A2U3NKT0_9MYCO|nr:Mycobacterium terramassiliense ORFan [Mycobacterium terramassiliense]
MAKKQGGATPKKAGTSPRVASEAARQLAAKGSTKAEKSVAGAALRETAKKAPAKKAPRKGQ